MVEKDYKLYSSFLDFWFCFGSVVCCSICRRFFKIFISEYISACGVCWLLLISFEILSIFFEQNSSVHDKKALVICLFQISFYPSCIPSSNKIKFCEKVQVPFQSLPEIFCRICTCVWLIKYISFAIRWDAADNIVFTKTKNRKLFAIFFKPAF